MDTLAQRVKKARQDKKLTQIQLAGQVGVSQNAIFKIENGETKAPGNILQLAQALGVDPNWLQFGTGSNSIATTEPEYANLVSPEDDEHHHRLDWLDVRAAAGLVEYSNADCPEIIQSIWLSDDGMLELVGKRSANGLRIINVPTDSMEPTIPKGAMVVLDTKTAHYTGDGIYAFSIDGNLFIKRLQRKIKGGYLVISDNKPKYRDEEMESEFIDNAVFVGKFVRVWEIKATEL